MLPVALGDGGDTLLTTCGKQEEKETPSNSPYESTPKIRDFSGTPQGGEFG